ncbi:hypothetical protein AB0M02_20690 [Actinoplanes sp. NPDC051861]|uniref:hypothetical protein n=1 Tax=Actinoplanes sp. NPDC051861 TaxID=3155170 RepID=UPI003434EC5C
MAETHQPAEPKKIHGDKLAEAFIRPGRSATADADESGTDDPGDVRLLSRHPGASSRHVVRR